MQVHSCLVPKIGIPAIYLTMATVDDDIKLVQALIEWADTNPNQISKRIKMANTTINRFANGSAKTRLHRDTLTKLQEAYPDFPGFREHGDTRSANVVPMPKRAERSDHSPTRSVDGGETASVIRLDLSYSMGPGRDLDESYVDGEAFEFDLGFLRSLTITPAERLRIVDGIGDSMQPTLHDRDLLFIDINQATLNAQDRIWAIWLFGLGAVKRLRAIDEHSVMVISDNPDVENQVVNRSDIIIHGRVVGSIKRH